MNKLTKEYIDALLDTSDVQVTKVGNKTCSVTLILANGFEITETAACVDPADYNEDLGREIALGRIENKLWELEGYRLQCSLNGNP